MLLIASFIRLHVFCNASYLERKLKSVRLFPGDDNTERMWINTRVWSTRRRIHYDEWGANFRASFPLGCMFLTQVSGEKARLKDPRKAVQNPGYDLILRGIFWQALCSAAEWAIMKSAEYLSISRLRWISAVWLVGAFVWRHLKCVF